MSEQLKDKVASHEAFSDIYYTIETILDSGSFIVCFSYDRSNDHRNEIKVRDYHNKEDISFSTFYEKVGEEVKEDILQKAREIEKTL